MQHSKRATYGHEGRGGQPFELLIGCSPGTSPAREQVFLRGVRCYKQYKKLLAHAREVKFKTDRSDLIKTACWDALLKRMPGEIFEAEASGENVHREDEFIYWALIKGHNKVAIHHVTW